MIDQAQKKFYQENAMAYFTKAGIVLTAKEQENLEFADFGLNEIDRTGLILVTYVNTNKVCAKELVMLPGMTCPEHRHPDLGGIDGKEETFRCRYGKIYLYVDGEPTANPHARPPKERAQHYTVWHEVILEPGEQYTLAPNTRHWFQSGDEGAVVSEFSTTSRDDKDIFTDPDITR